MRALAVIGVLLAAGCGFAPHQTYLDMPDASGDGVVALDAQETDLQVTAGPPDAAGDATTVQPPDAPEAGRQDATTPAPDLAPALPEVGPEAPGQPDLRSIPDAQPDSQPDVRVDSPAEVLSPPDVAPDRGPDVVSRDAGTDLPPPCSGCADPAWFCTSCTNPIRPIAVQCFGGVPVDCKGQPMFVSWGTVCPPAGSAQICMGCNQGSQFICDGDPNCAKNLRCPDLAPYCNATTGACSATPI
jgi:hypothetical protein